MKINAALITGVIILSSACVHSQDNNKGKNGKNEPKVDVKVNKEYDDKGNVIRYDSTYSYSFSDSSSTGLNDSLRSKFFGSNPFLNDPFFGNNFNMNADPFAEMERMMKQMDSLRFHGFQQPLLIPAPDNSPPPSKYAPPKQTPKPILQDTIKRPTRIL